MSLENSPKNMFKMIALGVVGVISLILVGMNVGINDAGQRTVIQYPNGNMTVRFEPGIYFPFFGKTTVYNDYLTYDFSAEDGSCDFEQNDGNRVRYQDGGEGIVCGMANVQLPVDEVSMIKMHKRFRSEDGVRAKLLDQAIPKALNLTAALMSSEEAYATKRSEYIRMSREQTEKGLYKTKLVEKTVVVGIDENGKTETQLKEVPEIIVDANNMAITTGSDLDLYSMNVAQFDLKAWDFESKTIKQIQDKREAEMAIVTSKANAKKAYWEEQQVRAEGEKNVSTAEYEARVAAEKMIQEAERDKALALIEASKIKEKAIELTAAAVEATKQKTQEALQAVQEAKVITTLANAEAYKLKEVQKGGILKLKIDAMVTMNRDNAAAQAKRKVPTTVIYSGGEGKLGSGSDVANLLDTQLIKNLQNLGLDMKAGQ